MQRQEAILAALIKDNKPRKSHATTPFGDIIFSEDNGLGDTVFSICLIYMASKYGFSDGIEKKIFFHEIRTLASIPNTTFNNLLSTLSSKLPIPENCINEFYSREGVHKAVVHRLGELTDNEVYAYCPRSKDNTDFPFVEKMPLDEYHQIVLADALTTPMSEYSDLWELNSEDGFSKYTQKLYYGYGFNLPSGILSCPNLKSLAIWHYSVRDELDFSRIPNLNELTLRDLHSKPNELLASIDQLPYLVHLDLSSLSDLKYGGGLDVPPTLHKLQALRYFDFSGNELTDWSQLLTTQALEVLKLSHSKLDNVPDNINLLSQLKELDLSHNNLTELPESLQQLENLQILNISNNPLQTLPAWLTNMTQLTELDLSQTQLETLPDTITNLTKLTRLNIKKNPFKTLPSKMLKLPKKKIDLEERNKALYDPKVKAKIEKYPKGEATLDADFNFKLMVIQKLMYDDEVLLPQFDVYDFAKNYSGRTIDIEKEGYDVIPEVEDYFKKLLIPMELLIDIKELEPDGGDEIYSKLIPFWDGEDESFEVMSVADAHLLPNLKRISRLFLSKEVIKELRSKKIKVNNG